MTPEQKIQFHKDMLRILINAYLERGVSTIDQVNALDGKSKLEDSLWKIPEAYGKSNQRYISQGIKEIRDQLDDLGFTRNSKSIWTKNQIDRALNMENHGLPFENIDDFKFQLEHVVEKSILVPMLLNAPDEIDNIINNYNIGCLVLKSEHNDLPDRMFDINNAWVRYEVSGLRVWDTHLKVWVF